MRDLPLLLDVQNYFEGIGSIGKSGNMAYYSISSVKELENTVIPHFEKYLLLTQAPKGSVLIFYYLNSAMI